MSSGHSIVGYSKDRQENDFYPTPPEAVLSLLKRESFNDTIWECACGNGAISKVLEDNGYNVISTDLYDYGYGEAGIDFLKVDTKEKIDIVTNPPYKHGLEFVYQCKEKSKDKFALLLKTVFLEGITRYDMFNDAEFPLKVVYQFCQRVPIYKNGIKTKNSGLIAYAWFVWDRNYSGRPTIEWIKKIGE